MSALHRLACACLLSGVLGSALAQSGIYTCVDAAGRRLTADRPIAQCSDRIQRELNPSGTLRRTVPPTPTAAERTAREAQERKAAEETQRLAEEKRLQKLLLARYPNQAAHDADRARALANITQPQERKRINARFDEELQRLKALWAETATTSEAQS
jgi:hypothetical protein